MDPQANQCDARLSDPVVRLCLGTVHMHWNVHVCTLLTTLLHVLESIDDTHGLRSSPEGYYVGQCPLQHVRNSCCTRVHGYNAVHVGSDLSRTRRLLWLLPLRLLDDHQCIFDGGFLGEDEECKLSLFFTNFSYSPIYSLRMSPKVSTSVFTTTCERTVSICR